MNLTSKIESRISGTSNKRFTGIIVKIAIAAIALSLAVMIITTAMIRGFQNQISEKIFGFWGHIHLYDTNYNRSQENVPIDIGQEYYQQLKELKNVDFQKPSGFMGIEFGDTYTSDQTNGGIKHVQSFTIIPGILSTKEELEAIFAKGIGTDFDWERMSQYLVEGEPIDLKDGKSKDAWISTVISNRLNLKLGDKFNVDFFIDGKQRKRQFQIKGLYNTGLNEYDKRFILIDQSRIQQLLEWEKTQVGGIEVFVENLDDVEAISEFIYFDILPSNLYSETIKDKFGGIFEWLELQNINERVILLLMVVVSIINMITALLILILERSKMIGILKSLGMRNWDIRKIFLRMAGRIVSYGLLIGSFAGIMVCLLQKWFGFIKLDEQNYYLSVAPIELDLWTLILLNVSTIIITLIFLILPTYLVTYISPVKALRFD